MIQGTHQVFPIKDETDGMNLRTYMATKFMAAHIAAGGYYGIVDASVQAADALIAELNKPQEAQP